MIPKKRQGLENKAECLGTSMQLLKVPQRTGSGCAMCPDGFHVHGGAKPANLAGAVAVPGVAAASRAGRAALAEVLRPSTPGRFAATAFWLPLLLRAGRDTAACWRNG